MAGRSHVLGLQVWRVALASPEAKCPLRADAVGERFLADLRATLIQNEGRKRKVESLDAYLRSSGRKPGQVLFPGRGGPDRSLTTRQYARLVERWVANVVLTQGRS